MKNVWILLIAGVITANAQFFTIGPKLGVASSEIELSEQISNPDFATAVDAINSGARSLGYHAGLFARVTVAGFYVQPELLFTSTSGTLDITQAGMEDVLNLTYNRVDVPVMLGKTFVKVFRVNFGPSFQIPLSSDVDYSNLSQINLDQANQEGISNTFDNAYNSATIGWQAGVGLDLWKLTVDLKYEGGFGAIADNIGSFPTDQRANQWILSAGIKLF